jgi:hypothetical protein
VSTAVKCYSFSLEDAGRRKVASAAAHLVAAGAAVDGRSCSSARSAAALEAGRALTKVDDTGLPAGCAVRGRGGGEAYRLPAHGNHSRPHVRQPAACS